MKNQFNALSIVAPSGQRIRQGIKTLEIRSWQPNSLPLKNLIIVENKNFLDQDGDEEEGLAVAIVDIASVHIWRPDEIEPACASVWSEGYYAWVITNIRPIHSTIVVKAKRKIYEIEIDPDQILL